MFPKDHNKFSWNELSWVATKAKAEPISIDNWHGDSDGDAQQVQISNPTRFHFSMDVPMDKITRKSENQGLERAA